MIFYPSSEQPQQLGEYVDMRYANASVDDDRAAATHSTTEQQSIGNLPPMARINKEATDPVV